MGQPAEKRPRAIYADYAAVPETQHAEIIDGELYTFPRPRNRHVKLASRLGMILGSPFDLGNGGPGGWHILYEQEIHLVDEEPVVPDLSGWRRERLPEIPDEAFISLAPDWACEVLSPSTVTHDRERKMSLYARHDVPWYWIIDPPVRTLEVYVLGEGGRWKTPLIHRGDARVRVVPFDAIELDLSVLWAK
jgi:Uma2 family endonuclease